MTTFRKPKAQITQRMIAAVNNFHSLASGRGPVDIPAARAKPVQHEHREQVALMHWWRYEHVRYGIPLFALLSIPNAGMGRNAVQGARLKAEGVRAGVSDLFLAVSRDGKHGLWIELKAMEGRVSTEQVTFLEGMRALGYAGTVCYGADEAIKFIKAYLGEPHGL